MRRPRGILFPVIATMGAIVVGAVALLSCLTPADDDKHQSEPPPEKTPKPVLFVRRYVAEQARVQPDEIRIVKVERVVWPDGCLGVPAPEMCAPGEVPGFRVVLEVSGKKHVYHTDKNEGFRFAGFEGEETKPGPAATTERGGNEEEEIETR